MFELFSCVIGKIELNFRQFEGILSYLEAKFEFYSKFRKETSLYKNVVILVAPIFIIDLNIFCSENRVNSKISSRR